LIQSGKRNASKRERDETANSKLLLSNSLAVRKLYIEDFGGRGQVPGPVQLKRPGTSTEQPVFLIGTEILPPVLWEKLDSVKIKIPL
jgi:hypothetical protein